MLHEPLFDPETQEWVYSDGRRLFRMAGGSSMMDDELPPGTEKGDDEEEEEEAPSGADDREEERDEDWEPPTRAEVERMKTALRQYRQEKRELKVRYEEKIKNMSTEGTAAAKVEIEKAVIEAEQRVERKWLRRTVRAAAAAQFTAAGASVSNAERLARMVDLDKVTVDDGTEEFDGLDEEVETLIEDNPEFFKRRDAAPDDDSSRQAPRRAVPRGGGVDSASRGSQGRPPRSKPKSTAEIMAARALQQKPSRLR